MSSRYMNGLFYVLLGAWLAVLICEGVAAITIFRSVKEIEASPGISPYDSEVFESRAPTIVAGGAARDVVHAFHVIQIVFAVLLVVCLLFQMRDRRVVKSKLNVARYAACLTAIVCLSYLVAYVSPLLNNQWGLMYSLEVDGAIRHTAREYFEKLHFRSEMVIGMIVLAIGATMAVSPLTLGSSSVQDQVAHS